MEGEPVRQTETGCYGGKGKAYLSAFFHPEYPTNNIGKTMAVDRISASLARYQDSPYTTLINESLDSIQCPIAFAVYVYLQSKPEGWIVRRSDVMKRFSIGRDRYDKAIRKLKDVGLVTHEYERDENGRICQVELVIHYQPQH